MLTENFKLSGIKKSKRLTIVAIEDRIRASSFIMKTILSQLEEEFGTQADFLKIDSTVVLPESGESSYIIPPVCVFLKNGAIVEIFWGLVSKFTLNQRIQKHLSGV